jgi:putative MATE family efflux protein
VFVSLMRGYCDTVTRMLVMFGSVVLNIVLDPFLIFGWGAFPELGIQGAAIATVFSRGLAMVVGLAVMFRGRRGVQINLRDMAPDFGYLRRLLRIGLPATVEGTGRALSMNLLLVVVALFPDPVVAAYGIGTRVFSVIFLPAIAVARGVETMTGQNVGAGKPDRAAQANYVAAKVLFAILAVVGVVTFFVPRPIVAVFTNDPAVVDVGATFLRYVAPTFGFIGIMRAFTGGFRGAGNVMVAAAISVITLAGIRLPVAFVASEFFLGASGIWLAFGVSNVLGATIAWLWFRRDTWREGDVRGASGPGPADASDADAALTDD